MISGMTEWIGRQVEEAGAAGVVFGLSGGLDSAVVGALCRRALGDDTLGLIMPCYSSPVDQEDAVLVAEALGIETALVDLAPAFEAIVNAVPGGGPNALENLKPRLRMAALYFIANDRNYLVAGTGNRSEIYVGYFTKHGDGAADILPIANIYKSDLREFAVELGVPSSVIEKPPSAGLREGQTDEGDFGLSYDVLDGILKDLALGREPRAAKALANRVREMSLASEHKRKPAPAFDTSGLTGSNGSLLLEDR